MPISCPHRCSSIHRRQEGKENSKSLKNDQGAKDCRDKEPAPDTRRAQLSVLGMGGLSAGRVIGAPSLDRVGTAAHHEHDSQAD